MSKFVISTWDNEILSATRVRISNGERYIQMYVAWSDLEYARFPQIVMRVTLEELIRGWKRDEGQELYLIGPVPGLQGWNAWKITAIDGRDDLDTRKAITNR